MQEAGGDRMVGSVQGGGGERRAGGLVQRAGGDRKVGVGGRPQRARWLVSVGKEQEERRTWEKGLSGTRVLWQLLAAPCPRGRGEVAEAEPLAAAGPSGWTAAWTGVRMPEICRCPRSR